MRLSEKESELLLIGKLVCRMPTELQVHAIIEDDQRFVRKKYVHGLELVGYYRTPYSLPNGII